MRKCILFFILFYFLALLQTSFFAHVSFWGVIPNILILFVVCMSVVENADSFNGLFAALGAGFFLDVFSQGIFGTWCFILFISTLLIKILKRTYVRIPIS